MAKTKCVICKMFNVKSEIAKHPNFDTLTSFRILFGSLAKRDPKALASICDEHRLPHTFNVCVILLSETFQQLHELSKSHGTLSDSIAEIKIRQICGAKI